MLVEWVVDVIIICGVEYVVEGEESSEELTVDELTKSKVEELDKDWEIEEDILTEATDVSKMKEETVLLELWLDTDEDGVVSIE